VLLHNPLCSKSRATLALLQDRGADFVIREYLEDPLSAEELADLRGRLGRPVSDWLRPKEDPFVASGVARDASDDALIAVIAEHPICMERPIVVRGEQARVGRPPGDVLALLD
ncbi:MAG: arsenate reductase family protein, partial [Myxococcota bacterium]